MEIPIANERVNIKYSLRDGMWAIVKIDIFSLKTFKEQLLWKKKFTLFWSILLYK